MPDIFLDKPIALGGAFSAEKAAVSFTGGASNALVQNVNATYQQNVTRLYEVGNDTGPTNIYYVGGRTQGTAGMARVLGPSAVIKAFYDAFGKVCNASRNNVNLTFNPLQCLPGGAGVGKAQYSLTFCVLTQVGISMAAQDMIVNEQSQLIFGGMDYQGG